MLSLSLHEHVAVTGRTGPIARQAYRTRDKEVKGEMRMSQSQDRTEQKPLEKKVALPHKRPGSEG